MIKFDEFGGTITNRIRKESLVPGSSNDSPHSGAQPTYCGSCHPVEGNNGSTNYRVKEKRN